ncbi:MAG: DUF6065 family protein [Hyphomicrobiaceae bacterium]|nr:DUF6065 family protein [Hyphomicrobiaceae bacterium]
MIAESSRFDVTASSAEALSGPLVRFHQLVEGGRPPRRADRSVGGTLPVRALRYCEPVSSASAFGWHVFLARRVRLLWDGSEVHWQMEGMADFEPLRSVHYPGFPKDFDASAPPVARGYAPPFLSASVQPGLVQVWPGSIARTVRGWSLLARPVVNLARPSGYELFEGIIETDHWCGPLFTNIRLTRTGVPVELDDDVPFMQVQPLEKERYSERFLASHSISEGVQSLSQEDWELYRAAIVEPNAAASRRPGLYAAQSRKEAAERGRLAAARPAPPRG